MLVEQAFDIVELGWRRKGDFALAAVGGEGTLAFLGARGSDDEVGKTARAGHGDAVVGEKLAVDSARAVVFGALFVGQIDADAHGFVVGQVFAGQLDNVFAVDNGAHQFVQNRIAAIGAFRGGGEAQAERRETEARAQGIAFAGQVVAFVEHHQPEATAQVLHM